MGCFFFSSTKNVDDNVLLQNVEYNYVVDFLNSAGYPQYLEEFKNNGFQSKSEIEHLTVELLTRMHVKVGHAKVIMSIIQKQNDKSVPLLCKSLLKEIPADVALSTTIPCGSSIVSTIKDVKQTIVSSPDPSSSTTFPCSPDVSSMTQLSLPEPMISKLKGVKNNEEKLIRHCDNFQLLKPNSKACDHCTNDNHYYYFQIDDEKRLKFDELQAPPFSYGSEPQAFFLWGVTMNQTRFDNKEILFQHRLAPDEYNWDCRDDDSRFDRYYKIDVVGHEFPEPDCDEKTGKLQLLRLNKGATLNDKKVKYFHFYFLFLM